MNSLRVENNICIITLDNKPHNYLEGPEFVNTNELALLIKNEKCKAIVISGAGRHFSAGANRDNLFQMAANGSLKAEIEKGKKLLQGLLDFKLPIIACIEGSCFGGGLEIALNADIKIASKKAMFAFPETNLNVIPGLNGIHLATKITGKANALEMVLKGDIINAELALTLGLIDKMVEAKSTLQKGLMLAGLITDDRSIDIIQAVVECVRNAEELPYDQAIQRETELFCDLAKKEAKENPDAMYLPLGKVN